MKVIERRLLQLEQDTPAAAQCYVWPSIGETVEEAIARQYPEGIAETARMIVLRFADPPDDGCGRPG